MYIQGRALTSKNTPTPINPTASFGLIYRDAVPMVAGGVKAFTCCLSTPHLPCPSRLPPHVACCWVSDDLTLGLRVRDGPLLRM
jgi:hypothetical protein